MLPSAPVLLVLEDPVLNHLHRCPRSHQGFHSYLRQIQCTEHLENEDIPPFTNLFETVS